MSYHRSDSLDFEYDLNPYESFMRNHLKHYGYYTGRNENYRKPNKALKAWDRANGYELSDGGSDTEYENQALKDADKNDAEAAGAEGQSKRTTQIVFSLSSGKMVPKLREPRNLYALSKESGPQQAPRWPADIEVLADRMNHVEDIPSENEPFYQPSGFEKTPMPLPEGEGRVVYNHPRTHEEYFLRSRVGGNRNGPVPRAAKLKNPDDSTLVFESRFESGNLMKAIQVSEFEYELELRYDLYTNKHTQWFYFRFGNTRKNARYRFTITNFMKSGSLYNSGMKPLMYSQYGAQTKGQGWRRVGDDIKYYKNDVRRKDLKGDRNFYYSLTWTFTVTQDNDTCFFAHCYPYTYSDLQDYLQTVANDPVRNRYCKQRILCRSLAGNVVYLLTITSPSINPNDAKVKKAVVVTARVHPGETNASWMMKGFLDYLTSEMPDAKLLRDMFVFKIVPMLNPDGVIVGNYRCSLAGRDLNRNYKTILKDSFPSVTHTKAMVKKLLEEREVIVYCDLHGHSRKQNVFIYGCNNNKNMDLRLKERVFPIILYNNAGDKFNYNCCKFKVQKSKEGTGRVVVWQMGVMNSYTMEASFCGSTAGDKRLTHFTTADFEAMGYHFCDTLLDYCDPDETKYNQIFSDLEEKLRQEILAHLERTGTPLPPDGLIDLSVDYASGVESSTTGSDSSADDGLPVHLIALAPKLSKKKKLKTRKERDKKRLSAEKGKEKEKDKEKSGSASSHHHGDGKESEAEKKGSAKDKKDKEKLRYRHGDRSSLHSAGRGRHTPCRGEGGSPYAPDRNDSKNLKKTEYLEALTNAYLMSGILKPAPDEPASLRYSTGAHGLGPSGPGQVEGLCPHHEKAFAEQFVANQLAGLSFADDKYNWSHTAIDARRTIHIDSTSHHSAPASRDRRTPASVEPAQLITTTAPHAHPIRPRSDHHQPPPSRGAGARHAASPSKAILTSAEGVAEAMGDNRRGSDFVKRGVSSESMSLRTNNCPASTNYTVHDASRSLDPAMQPLKMVGHHGNTSSSSPDVAASRSKERQSNAMTPAGYQELMARKGSTCRSEGTTNQGFPVHLSIVTGTTHSASQSQGLAVDKGQAAAQSSTSQPHAPGQKTQPSTMVGEAIANQKSSGPHDTSINQTWPKAAPQARNHNCATEATPITDPSHYTQRSPTPSSHHFHKAQDFYGGGSPGSGNNHPSDRHPTPASLGSAARLQAKYGRKVASTPNHDGETSRSYRSTLKPVGRKNNANTNNNNSPGTSPEIDDVASNEFPSTSDDVGDEAYAPVKQTVEDSVIASHNGNRSIQYQGEMEMESNIVKLTSASHHLISDGSSPSYANPGGVEKAEMMTNGHVSKRLDIKAELERSVSKSSSVDNPIYSDDLNSLIQNDPSLTGRGVQEVTHGRKESPVAPSSSHPQDATHKHPTPVYSQNSSPRSKPDTSKPLQRSPRLLDRSTVQRGVDGSIHLKKVTPRERAKSGVATAQDLQDLGYIYNQQMNQADLDMLISMDDNPYRVSLDSAPDPVGKDSTPHPSARMNSAGVKPMSITTAMSLSHSPRVRPPERRSSIQRPLSSKRRETSPRQQQQHHQQQQHSSQDLQISVDMSHQEPQGSPRYFSVSKLSLQNRLLDKPPSATPRSALSEGAIPARVGNDGEGRTEHSQSSVTSSSVGSRPKTQAGSKPTANGHQAAKGQGSSPAGDTPRKAKGRERGADPPTVVVHQGGFMGHRPHPSFLKVQYNKKR